MVDGRASAETLVYDSDATVVEDDLSGASDEFASSAPDSDATGSSSSHCVKVSFYPLLLT